MSVAECDEKSIPHAGEVMDPPTIAVKRALLKAQTVGSTLDANQETAIVIGCDQTLALDGVCFDKASDAGTAVERLTLLAGKTHYLHSAYVLWSKEQIIERVVSIPMPMRTLTTQEIANYVATNEWKGSVGCYQFENRGVNLFEGVAADQSAIVGLPLQSLLKDLRAMGCSVLG